MNILIIGARPAKMNRAVLVQRPEPSNQDIALTGNIYIYMYIIIYHINKYYVSIYYIYII